MPFLRFAEDSEEMKYLRARREALGGYLPSRRRTTEPLPVPPLSTFDALLKATAEGREISTTMAFVRILTTLLRDKDLGPRVVPIVPDESRTFGMEGLFRQVGIFSQVGQLYRPQDADQLMYYREDPKGQILQEGINEPGAMASFIAAGTSYSTSNVPMIPFYIYYSMFGFQRIGDLAWAAGDMRTRGFLIGGTSGRTTLNGEGLQHEDGHSHVLASTIPNCVSYDPTYAYELAVIVHARPEPHAGRQRGRLLLHHHAERELRPSGDARGGGGGHSARRLQAARRGGESGLRAQRAASRRGLDPARGRGGGGNAGRRASAFRARCGASPASPNCAAKASTPNAGRCCIRRKSRAIPYITQALAGGKGPVIASTDYMKALADGVRPYVPARYKVLGTDGFGRSDYRRRLRSFFEVDRYHVAVASLKALADDQLLPSQRVAEAIDQVRHRSGRAQSGAQLIHSYLKPIPFAYRREEKRRWRKLK